MKKRKFFNTNILLIIILLIGVVILLYPSVSNHINNLHQIRAVVKYKEDVVEIEDDDYNEFLEEAKKYNQRILKRAVSYSQTESEKKEYENILNIGENGMMGYVDIPTINISLPFYHGTESKVIETAIGHIEWTSLPVGGESTHTVLASHSGFPSAKLFTDLNKLKDGDIFEIHVLDEVLKYKVDKISVVLPDDIDDIMIEEGKDYCTLMTCTPYRINTHRLLVRGSRVIDTEETEKEEEEKEEIVSLTTEAVLYKPILVVPILAVPVIIVLSVFLYIENKLKKHFFK